MAVNQERIDTRRAYGLLAGIIVASVALGLVVWKIGDFDWPAIFYTMFVVIGVYLFIVSFFMDAALDFAPSDSSFYLVIGTLLTTVGVLAFVDLLTDVEMWLLVAIFIFVFALLIIFRSISKKG